MVLLWCYYHANVMLVSCSYCATIMWVTCYYNAPILVEVLLRYYQRTGMLLSSYCHATSMVHGTILLLSCKYTDTFDFKSWVTHLLTKLFTGRKLCDHWHFWKRICYWLKSSRGGATFMRSGSIPACSWFDREMFCRLQMSAVSIFNIVQQTNINHAGYIFCIKYASSLWSYRSSRVSWFPFLLTGKNVYQFPRVY
jgi:hypothetical protein